MGQKHMDQFWFLGDWGWVVVIGLGVHMDLHCWSASVCRVRFVAVELRKSQGRYHLIVLVRRTNLGSRVGLSCFWAWCVSAAVLFRGIHAMLYGAWSFSSSLIRFLSSSNYIKQDWICAWMYFTSSLIVKVKGRLVQRNKRSSRKGTGIKWAADQTEIYQTATCKCTRKVKEGRKFWHLFTLSWSDYFS